MPGRKSSGRTDERVVYPALQGARAGQFQADIASLRSMKNIPRDGRARGDVQAKVEPPVARTTERKVALPCRRRVTAHRARPCPGLSRAVGSRAGQCDAVNERSGRLKPGQERDGHDLAREGDGPRHREGVAVDDVGVGGRLRLKRHDPGCGGVRSREQAALLDGRERGADAERLADRVGRRAGGVGVGAQLAVAAAGRDLAREGRVASARSGRALGQGYEPGVEGRDEEVGVGARRVVPVPSAAFHHWSIVRTVVLLEPTLP